MEAEKQGPVETKEIVGSTEPVETSGKGQEPTSTKNGDNLRTISLVAYGCLAVAPFLGGLSAIVAVVLAYLKRREASGTIYQSHMSWIIVTFWIGLLITVIGIATSVFFVGMFILIGGGIWWLYRVIRGGLAAIEGKPVKQGIV